jgi:triacylglycerol lipase
MVSSALGEARYGLELASLVASPVYRRPGRAADPLPVLLVPGFLAGDGSLRFLADWLRRRGHAVSLAAMWANVDCSAEALRRLEQRVERGVQRSGRRVALVGQSRGGTMSRALAVRRPDLISHLVTLGSPVLDQLAVNPVVRATVRAMATLGSWGMPGVFSRDCLEGDCCASVRDEIARPLDPGVRAIAVFSRSDGVVDWRSCLDASAEHVEVTGSHCGMSVATQVYELLARVLDAGSSTDATLPAAA